ncbi:DUF5367 family protein [uncultured Aquimarina sp.]|uniref:DUF5367 family protein n=1 Tax=uncultured Aquimarina sp. TaxID=575652 RepID=UPI00262EC1B6|nr:DUF5367 family protein [uncultured Aquimarina sp.]
MKIFRLVTIGIGIWILAVCAFTFSYEFQILHNPEQQANMVLSLSILPLVWLGSSIYYKNGVTTNGYIVGVVFFLIAAFLDTLITVPLFIMPNGGNYYTFFTDFSFWIIAIELVGVAMLFYYLKVYPKVKTIKA